MIELKYKSWKEITIKVFDKIKEIKIENDYSQEKMLDKNVELLSVLCDCTEEDIINLPLTQFNELLKQTEFLKELPKVNMNDAYTINGTVYEVHRNLRDMKTSQYIDFQSLSKEKEKNFANILACFLIPKGKSYGEGYDVINVAEDIYNYFNIVDARSIMFFFTLQFHTLTRVMLTYSIKKMKRATKKSKSKEMEAKIKELETNLTQVKDLLKNGIGFF